jgi:hypothetical protein
MGSRLTEIGFISCGSMKVTYLNRDFDVPMFFSGRIEAPYGPKAGTR